MDSGNPSREETAALERLAVLGETFAEVMHDINNLIGAASAYAEVELHQSTSPDSIKNLTRLRQSLELAGSVAARVMEFARPMEGEGSVDDVVRSVFDLFSYRTNKGIRFGWLRSPTLPQVAMPAAHAQIILANLVKNALDAVAHQSSPTIRVSAEHSEGRVIISVWNPGPPIPQDILHRIFEPFFTTKPRGKGTGLGLTIARRLAEASGATLSVRNADSGVIFSLSVPVAGDASHVHAIPQPAKAASPTRPSRGNLDGRRILLVDDNESIRKALQLLIQVTDGANVETATSGEEALDMLSRKRFDAIILDLRMPGISGQEVFDRLPDSTKRMVVFLTGDAVMTEGFLKSTGQPALFKPVTYPDLAKALQKVAAHQ